LRSTRHIIGRFGDESFQAFDCIGNDNRESELTKTKRKYTENTRKLTLTQVNWPYKLRKEHTQPKTKPTDLVLG